MMKTWGGVVAWTALLLVGTYADAGLDAALQDGKCHNYKSHDTCVKNECYWCKSAAVPSSCYSAGEAQSLPPAVFQCDKEAEERADAEEEKKAAMTHAPVFIADHVPVPFGEEAKSCHFYRTREKCLQNTCYWCKSAAVPSSCYSKEEATQLPPAVFQCEHDAVVGDMWELTETPLDAAGWEELFATWKEHFGMSYDTAMENQVRRNIFQHNGHMVAAHNADPDVTYKLELNQFADLTWDEFQRLYLANPQNCSATSSGNPLTYSDVPAEKDWRAEGVVSPVKNQGKCGSCWTFSTTGCLESHLKQKHGKFISLSEQNLIDCAQAFDNHGCSGGLPSHAFEYIKYNGGLDTEETYPYVGKDGKCKFNTYHVGVEVESVVNITSRSENELLGAVGTVGPVSIAYQVVDDFRFYKSGVYSSKKCKQGEQDVNHAVLAVGYGTENGQKHWIVKNSWGTKWGMKGFFQILRGANMCGLADCASYPVVK